ncbi:helix-turn-helix domain-containing protein [bacterium]|nr:helix-turn-helix domain-containing protein [bacterium]
MDKEILTTFEAAKYCHVHPGTIKNWIRSEHLKAFKTPGGHRRIYRRDLDQFLKDNNIPIISENRALRQRVLIIDTDFQAREAISRGLLRRTELYEVATAEDAFEGGEMLAMFKPNLVILNQELHGLNTEEIAHRIKSCPYLSEVRVIMLTSYPERKKPVEQGVDHYFPIPVDPDKLSQETARLLIPNRQK